MRTALCAAIVCVAWGLPLSAAELKPATVAAFDRYVRATEARIAAEVADERRFLLADTGDEAARRVRAADLAAGRLIIEPLESRDNGAAIAIPGGLVHHWVGLAFVPAGTVTRAVALLQDYDRHAEVYQPAVQRSRVVSQSGDSFRVFLRFYMKKVIAVTLNSDHEARFTRASPTRAYSRVVSTRVQEVEDAGTSSERELPIGNDSGFLWRLNSYWRFLERDGGVYIQCESVSLTRRIPPGLGWVVGPFVTSIPRESLAFTLDTTRKVLTGSR
jgi:hypothetical protein